MTNIKVEKQGKDRALIVSGSLTIEYAGQFKDALTDSLKQDADLIVDLDSITDMDLSCLQLLCSAHRTFTNAKRSIKLAGIPDVLKQSVHNAGYKRNSGCTKEAEKTCFWVGI